MQKYDFRANHSVKHYKTMNTKALENRYFRGNKIFDSPVYTFPFTFQCFRSLCFSNNRESNRSSSNTEL